MFPNQVLNAHFLILILNNYSALVFLEFNFKAKLSCYLSPVLIILFYGYYQGLFGLFSYSFLFFHFLFAQIFIRTNLFICLKFRFNSCKSLQVHLS